LIFGEFQSMRATKAGSKSTGTFVGCVFTQSIGPPGVACSQVVVDVGLSCAPFVRLNKPTAKPMPRVTSRTRC